MDLNLFFKLVDQYENRIRRYEEKQILSALALKSPHVDASWILLIEQTSVFSSCSDILRNRAVEI